MTERLPTYAIEAITDAANLLMEIKRWFREGTYVKTSEHYANRLSFNFRHTERLDAVLDNLNQIIDGQGALGRPNEELPFKSGETS